ncbi:MAG: ABC transporter permease [Actinomycetota bacterium]|nr:ABC transporter permease [Actinomycetota bacterium]
MIGYIIRRLGQAIIVMLLVSMLVFLMLHALPGGLVRSQLGPKASRFAVHQLTIEEGLTKPLPVQYGIWLSHVVQGNLGFSYKQNTPVATLLGEYIPRDLILAGAALFVAILVSIPIGMTQGSRRNSAADYSFSGVLLAFYSMPYFLIGVIAIVVLNIWLGVLPSTAATFGQNIGTDVKVLVLPVLSLALANIAYFSRYLRSAVIDNLQEDYVRTARAKGAPRVRILLRHVLRNSLLPFISAVGISLPLLVSGALVIEVLFDYPGMGLLFWDAQQHRTYPVLLGIILVVSAAVVIGNLLADLAYAALDPRIRYD